MAFHVVYVAGGELDKVKRVEYVKEIKNFAQLSQPYNKMVMMNVPAIEGIYNLEWTSPNEDMELLSIVVTCSGYGENDYYNLYVNNERWFDTWFPTEVKEGLYIGTATYVYKVDPQTNFKMKFVNMSGTAKKVWMGFRFLKEKSVDSVISVPMLDVNKASSPEGDIGIPNSYYNELDNVTTDYTDPDTPISEEPVVNPIVTTELYQILVNKYQERGFSEVDAKVLAFNNYYDYLDIYDPPNDFDLDDIET